MTNPNTVTFDQAAYRTWLTEPADLGDGEAASRYDAVPQLATAYQRHDGDAGWLTEQTLDHLRATAVWTYGPGVSDVQVWTTAGVESPTDGISGEVTVDGFVLSLGRLTEQELVPTEHDVLPGYEAAEHGLTALAERVNSVVEVFRQRLEDLTGVVDAEIIG